ncbi:Riboflavin kinase [Planctomycetes bacterium Pan216]|uniref:Bifunctional riboflavin kinase/FMN adenylyltransferase n=1 Tax=Kolteria novifilia TaxID=2527975 RepID=A0A518AX55_9BACT|nr:Riboflavin kinase [Planctomycetes bacterium Pan216]
MIHDCFDELPSELRHGVVSIGNFDGVHRGHRRLLARLRTRAQALGAPAIAVSFEPHPIALLRPQFAPTPLVWPGRKAELLRAAGADGVIIYQADHRLLDLEARAFFDDIIRGRLQAVAMVEGPNFGFGKGRAGNVDTLRQFCREATMPCDIVGLVEGEGEAVSSTRIRGALREGEIEDAQRMLGRPHRIRGKVVQGDQRGATIGFPTANLESIPVLVPKDGVYAVRVHVGETPYAGACHVGTNPTFDQEKRKVEIHLLDYSGSLYGAWVEVDFLSRLRGTERFADLAALKAQLAQDVDEVRRRVLTQEQEQERSSAARRAELCSTISEWIMQEVEPSLRTTGGSFGSATLQDDGLLQLRWRFDRTPLPHERQTLLFGLEQQLRRVFPEVTAVTSTTDSMVST